MTGVTGLRPLTNDPGGTQTHKHDNPEHHSTKQPNVLGLDTAKVKGTYVRTNTNKSDAGNDEYRDDETVKTVNSSTINTEITIYTDTLYENEEDGHSKLSLIHITEPTRPY